MITLSEPARYYFHHSCPGQQQQDIGAGPAQGKGADSDSGDRSEERESTQKAASRNTQLVSRLDTGQGCRRRDSFKIAEPLHMLDHGDFSAKTR